jgi:hypothetical protein
VAGDDTANVLLISTKCNPAARHVAPAGFFHALKPPHVAAQVAEIANPIADLPELAITWKGTQRHVDDDAAGLLGTTLIPPSVP